MNVIAAYTTRKIARLFQNKDVLHNDIKPSIIYQYECRQCNRWYIGETFRHFKTRQPTPTEISFHEHIAINSEFKIIGRADNNLQLLIKESIYQKKFKNKHLLLNDMSGSIPLRVFMTN